MTDNVKFKNILTSLRFENFEFTKEEIERIKAICDGKISADEVCKNIIKEYK